MKVKQNHCTPICAIPSRPAMQAKLSLTLQQSTACRLSESRQMFAKAEVAEMVPRRIK